MRMIKPVVNLEKIINDYDTIVLGCRGVISDGLEVFQDALLAIKKAKLHNKNIVVLSNSAMRVKHMVSFLEEKGLPIDYWDMVMTAGEIMHYKMRNKLKEYKSLGNRCYCLGSKEYLDVMSDLDIVMVDRISDADFLYVSTPETPDDMMEKYIPILEEAAAFSIPLVCVGNDISSFYKGILSLGSGAIAEQYAVLGGQIITIGKPSEKILLYTLGGFETYKKERTLIIGDSLVGDIKIANMLGIDSLLISKGIHVNFLGESYIPDVSKARSLANHFEAYPDFIMSNFRW